MLNNMNFLTTLLMALMLLPPAIMLAFGVMMRCGWPKEPNNFMGFRTARAKSSAEAWRFAHSLCGKMWTASGAVFFAVQLATIVIFLTVAASVRCDCGLSDAQIYIEWTNPITFILTPIAVLSSIVMLITVAITQSKLCKNFNEDGTPKQATQNSKK